MSVITIRGQLGSGAPEIGQIIAEKLAYRYLDQEIVTGVAGRADRSPEYIASKEMPAGTLYGKLFEAINSSFPVGMAREGVYVPGWEFPLEDSEFFRILKQVVEDAALQGNVVIRGRGSQFILKNHPDAFHILTVAPLVLRVKRMAASYCDDVDAALKAILQFDRSRRQFIKRYFKAEIEDPVHYNLVINTSDIGYEEAADLSVYNLQKRKDKKYAQSKILI